MIAKHFINKYVIVRTTGAGVHAGFLTERAGKNVLLTKSRRIWYWKGAFTLSAVATNGLDVDQSKLGCEIPEIFISDVWEIIPCSDKAITTIRMAPVYIDRAS